MAKWNKNISQYTDAPVGGSVWDFAKNNKLDLGFTAASMLFDIARGEGVMKTVGKGVFDYIMWDVASAALGGGVSFGIGLMNGAVAGVEGLVTNGRNNTEIFQRSFTGPGRIGGGFLHESENAQTMRQRSLEAMGGHTGLVNSSLGSEARRRSAFINY